MDKSENFKEFMLDVTYQDTDAAGVVYFANYFNMAERARCKIMKHFFGTILPNDEGNWAVKSSGANFLGPAKLGDTIVIKTYIESLKSASFIFKHNFYVANTLICSMDAQLLCINSALKPARIPNEVKEKLLLITKIEEE